MAPIPSRFGPYEVIALLGAGGMGEVYRARDPRLNRIVAIKVLARAGADPGRQQRFLDEAQAASALNHPNIITVFDVGMHDGAPFIVSELVEGTSVRDMLARAPLTIREVLDIGVQMADGLAAAHQAGIVHRDFKPENVMVTRDGRVKILDFGLALVGAREGSSSDMDVTLTATSQIVGTIPYMSPEQARGAAVDFRTDQFSFGLTMYEMSTGRRTFSAETSAQILAAIIEDEPEPIAKLNARVPAPVRWVIERCLSKDPRQRYDSTADLTRELRTLRDRLTELTSTADVVAPPRRRGRAALAVAALIAAAAIGALAVFTSSRSDAGLERYQFTPFATDAGYQASPAWSPDGKTLAFVADVDGILQIFTRALASSMRLQVTRSQFDCRDPFWSHDGTRLYFISRARDRDGLWSISASGGEPEIVMENVSRADLSPDGKTLAFFRDVVAAENATAMRLWLASPPESQPVEYTRPPFGAPNGYAQATLHFSPDGSKLGVWTVATVSAELTTEPSEFWVLPVGGGIPRHVPSPVPDLHGMSPAFSWLPDSRRILSAVPRPQPGLHMWLMDTERGDARLLVSTAGLENDPAVSPSGTRLALTLQQADFDLYQLSLDHPSPSVAVATSRNEMDPTWSASLTAMAFTTDRNGRDEIWLRSQKGDFERPLVTPDDFAASRTDFLSEPEISPDGRRVAYTRIGADGNRVWISPVAGGPPVQLAQGPQAQEWPSWSPDGVWIASGQTAVGKGTWALSKVRVGARTPPEIVASDILPLSPVHWAPSGNWIAYNGVRGLSIVSPDGQSTRVLHEDAWMAFAWSADSQKVYGIRQSDDLTHLTFTSVDVASGAEHVLRADIMAAPVARQPVRGLTLSSPTTFVASIVGVRSDVWLLDGLQPPPTSWFRLFR